MIDPNLRNVIFQVAGHYQLDALLVQAIVMQETAGNPWSTRFESEWKYFETPNFWAGKLGISVDTEKTLQAMSWGPMQLMGSVAREMGFAAELTRLVDPLTALTFSCAKFSKLCAKYTDENDIIASWNAGSPRKLGDQYANQHYVDGVRRFLQP